MRFLGCGSVTRRAWSRSVASPLPRALGILAAAASSSGMPLAACLCLRLCFRGRSASAVEGHVARSTERTRGLLHRGPNSVTLELLLPVAGGGGHSSSAYHQPRR